MSSQKFSEELIVKGQKYFEEKYGIKASKEEMDLWLDSLADFFSFFENSQYASNQTTSK